MGWISTPVGKGEAVVDSCETCVEKPYATTNCIGLTSLDNGTDVGTGIAVMTEPSAGTVTTHPNWIYTPNTTTDYWCTGTSVPAVGHIPADQLHPLSGEYAIMKHVCEELTIKSTIESFSVYIGGGIADVKVYNDRAVVVTFADGTSTKAVCDKDDTFCLETGITVCLMKKMLGGQEEGTRLYSKIIRGALRVYRESEKREAEEQAEKEAEKQRKRKAELKRAAKRLRRKEEAIDIQKQGFLRAMQEREWHNDDLK